MIGLVACSAQKLSRVARARELYCSPLFRATLAYAESRCNTVYALSALWGLVKLDAWVAPYNRRLGGKKERLAWGVRVASQLIDRHGRDDDYLVLAGTDYAEPLGAAMHRYGGHNGTSWQGVPRERIHQPLAKLRVGERLRWLRAQTQTTAPASGSRRPWREVLQVDQIDDLCATATSLNEMESALLHRHQDALLELGAALRDGIAEFRQMWIENEGPIVRPPARVAPIAAPGAATGSAAGSATKAAAAGATAGSAARAAGRRAINRTTLAPAKDPA